MDGTLTLANNVEAVLAADNMLTELQLPNANRLQFLDVSGNELTTLPSELAQLPNLQALHIDDNQLTALPDIWTAENLRDFTASRNQIEVCGCV
jgi:Leucine-rich repeat (LRR) protein